MSTKSKTPAKAKAGLLAVDPMALKIAAKTLDRHFAKALKDIGATDLTLLKGLKLSPLGGDPPLEVPGAEPEPVYEAKTRANIQGNIIPGFNKDHQQFLFFRLGPVAASKRWLRWIEPLISSMEDVLAFVRAHRAMRLRLGVREPPMCATWANIAFSHHAIAKLVSQSDADQFGDESFRQGLLARARYLGDPTRKAHRGHPSRWVVGRPKREADILVIVAADDPRHLDTMVDVIKARALADGLKLLFEQRGDTLPGNLRGHEHFGFKDGVSQPAVRGKVSSALGDYVTPRYIDVSDPRARLFAKPGQPLIWPGQFLLGEPRQNPQDLYASSPAAANFPNWAARGSYLVCRRLRQDVRAFWRFVAAGASVLGISDVKFASMLVGRWPSGAPLMRTPAADNTSLAGDDWANNHFLFDDDTRPSNLRPIPGYGGDGFAQARQDMLGNICPHFAHIRKSNPRDSATDLGKPHDALLRLILRRGIPFGKPIFGVRRPSPKLIAQERGLMFISYGATIEDQFEFLTRRWIDSPIQPNFGGHDPIIGQADRYGSRTRHIDFPTPAGARRLHIRDEWVFPSGGGYFFAPPINAISGVLGA